RRVGQRPTSRANAPANTPGEVTTGRPHAHSSGRLSHDLLVTLGVTARASATNFTRVPTSLIVAAPHPVDQWVARAAFTGSTFGSCELAVIPEGGARRRWPGRSTDIAANRGDPCSRGPGHVGRGDARIRRGLAPDRLLLFQVTARAGAADLVLVLAGLTLAPQQRVGDRAMNLVRLLCFGLAGGTFALRHQSRSAGQRGPARERATGRRLAELLVLELPVELAVGLGRGAVQTLAARCGHSQHPIGDRIGLSLEGIVDVTDLELRQDSHRQARSPIP